NVSVVPRYPPRQVNPGGIASASSSGAPRQNVSVSGTVSGEPPAHAASTRVPPQLPTHSGGTVVATPEDAGDSESFLEHATRAPSATARRQACAVTRTARRRERNTDAALR